MTEIMMALGTFRFSIDTAAYDRLSRTTAWRWPSQERIGRRPTRQFVGAGDDSLSLSGVILPTYTGGLGQIDALRELAGAGAPLMLSDGRGAIWGKWCVLSVAETRSVLFADGAPRKIEFVLELGHYGEDD